MTPKPIYTHRTIINSYNALKCFNDILEGRVYYRTMDRRLIDFGSSTETQLYVRTVVTPVEHLYKRHVNRKRKDKKK